MCDVVSIMLLWLRVILVNCYITGINVGVDVVVAFECVCGMCGGGICVHIAEDGGVYNVVVWCCGVTHVASYVAVSRCGRVVVVDTCDGVCCIGVVLLCIFVLSFSLRFGGVVMMMILSTVVVLMFVILIMSGIAVGMCRQVWRAWYTIGMLSLVSLVVFGVVGGGIVDVGVGVGVVEVDYDDGDTDIYIYYECIVVTMDCRC